MVNLFECDLDTMQHIKITNRMLSLQSFVIATNHPHLASHTAIPRAVESVVGSKSRYHLGFRSTEVLQKNNSGNHD
jgi:hypothetical protein